jgi:hypothetical protein
MLFELLLNGMDRFLNLRDNEMEMGETLPRHLGIVPFCLAMPPMYGQRRSRSIRAYTCKNHTVPYGTELLGWHSPRHFVPG